MLFESKMEHSAAEATRNINAVFGHENINDRTIKRWFKGSRP